MKPFFVASLLAAIVLTPALAHPLEVERVTLPGEGAGHQVYNYQEQGDWRVWARSAAGFKASQVWLQRRGADGRWGEAAPWALTDPRYRDSDPFLSADERRLLFISDRPAQPDAAPLAHLDVLESEWTGADAGDVLRWSAPQPVTGVQSSGYELGPERQREGPLWFASTRAGGPGRLSIYIADGRGETPRALPAPVNDAGGTNSDPTLSPDGRYLLWWSGRSGRGDLYLAERLANDRFGPALRLPAPVNSDDGIEFTPWISGDGAWLYFASTRASGDSVSGAADGLSKLYRVRWPDVLRALLDTPATR